MCLICNALLQHFLWNLSVTCELSWSNGDTLSGGVNFNKCHFYKSSRNQIYSLYKAGGRSLTERENKTNFMANTPWCFINAVWCFRFHSEKPGLLCLQLLSNVSESALWVSPEKESKDPTRSNRPTSCCQSEVTCTHTFCHSLTLLPTHIHMPV